MRTFDLPMHDSSPAGNCLPWSRPSGRIRQGRRPANSTTGTVVLLLLFIALLFGWSPAAFAQGQAEEFVFETRTVRYVLGANGRTISLLDKSSGKERTGDKPTPFAQVRVAGKTWPVTSLQRDGDTLLAKFGGSKVQVRYRILARDTHLTVELVAVEGAQPESIELCRVQPAPLQRTGSVLVVKWDADFTVCLMALSERVHSQVMGKDSLAASVYPEFGMVGEKVALIAVPTPTFLDVVQEVEKTYGLPSPTIDGVWAKQSPDVDTNYLFIDVSEETADQVIDYAKMGGFGYVLIPWRSWSTSRGSYPIDRKNFPKGEASLKATIDKFHAAGLKVGMHLMTSLISKNDPLVSPTPDPRLLKDATTTLAKDIDGRTTTITAGDDLAAFVDEGRQHDDGVDRGIDIQIDDEILFCRTTPRGGSNVFANCTRGAYGTTRKAHVAETPVYRLAQGAGGYVADLKTSLKEQIADRVADVINRCGFDMIYFDGGELSAANGQPWYYTGHQQQAIWQRIERDVLFQGSGMSHWLWHIFSRKTSDDHAAIEVRAFMDYHKIDRLKNYRANFMPGELGWCGLLAGGPDHPATTVADIEHYGVRMIGYDSPISIQSSLKKLGSNPQTEKIFKQLKRVDEVRRGEQVPLSQRVQMQTGNWSLFANSGALAIQPVDPGSAQPSSKVGRTGKNVASTRLLFQGNMQLRPASSGNKSFLPGKLICNFSCRDAGATEKDCQQTRSEDRGAHPSTLQDLRKNQTLAVTVRVSGQRRTVAMPSPVLNVQLEDHQGWYRDHYIDLDFLGEQTIVLPGTNVARLLPEFGRPEYKHKRAFRYFDYSKVAAVNLRWMRRPKSPGLTISLKTILAVSEQPQTGTPALHD